MTVARTDRNEGTGWAPARPAAPTRSAGAGERFSLAQDRLDAARADARIAAARQDRGRLADSRQAEAGREARRAEDSDRAALAEAAAKRAPTAGASSAEAAAPRSAAAESAANGTTTRLSKETASRPTGGAKARGADVTGAERDAEGKASSAPEGTKADAVTDATGKNAAAERATQEDEAATVERPPEGVAGPVPMPVLAPAAASVMPATGRPGAALSAQPVAAQGGQAAAAVPVGEGAPGVGVEAAGDTAEAASAKENAIDGAALGTGAKAFEAALAAAASEAGPTPAASPPSQNTAAPGGPSATAETAPNTQSTPALPAPIPLGAVPMTIGLRTLAGAARFAIRLDPIELGAIEVSLDLDREAGRARAHLTVDRPETLALLQRDAGALQQALAQAGFEASEGIGLSLRGEAGGQSDQNSGREPDRGAPGARAGTAPGRDTETILDPSALRRLRAVGGLDLRI
ncbi:hypothetical protein ASG52_16835 [Methylobacterium sp. Leaf456]|uniref:flagellar hook-length control protein FliK n=1 Tax=Methylobacterium sp. Leaf456 TaxID=1736382 RepID=UPI0006FB3E95|nr:flagellar hook-length control protein FliK [Methylobacterium sp. Leaf456]KQT60910.1 hypothetical protein ASG52_16835 [Methylobacterium sp. Leaf456]